MFSAVSVTQKRLKITLMVNCSVIVSGGGRVSGVRGLEVIVSGDRALEVIVLVVIGESLVLV